MIAVVDYGLGNVAAFVTIYHRLGLPVIAARTAEDLGNANHIILPGVGSFDWAMKRLDASGMREALDEFAKSRPVLGICVGMQIMARSSDEGEARGLEWIPGDVKRFDTAAWQQATRLPHMGWNDIAVQQDCALFQGLDDSARFYFLHSYHFVPDAVDSILAQADYNGAFTCAVRNDNVFGVQFHPEKSHQWGVRLLANFAEI